MDNKTCEICGRSYSAEAFSSCPFCNSLNETNIKDPKVQMIIEKNRIKDENDTEFRIEYNPQEKVSLKEDFKGIIVLLAIALIILIIFFPWVAINGLIFFSELSIGEIPSPMFIIFAIIAIGLIVIVIYLLNLLVKHKYLMTHGIIIKNVRFVVTKDSIRLNGQTTGLIKVKSEYVGDDGVTHVFKGILPGYLVKKGNLCDVLVDPNNFKKYIIRYVID